MAPPTRQDPLAAKGLRPENVPAQTGGGELTNSPSLAADVGWGEPSSGADVQDSGEHLPVRVPAKSRHTQL